MSRLSPVVMGLLVANLAVFAAGLMVPHWRETIIGRGAFWLPANELFGPWQAITYMFLHADLAHIFFNMFALLSFGSLLEREWGSSRFSIFYILCGVGAGLVQTGIDSYHFAALHEQLVAAGMTPEGIETLLRTGNGPMPTQRALQLTLRELYQIYDRPMVGASGAIYGVMVAFGMLYPNAKLALLFVPVPVAAKILIPVLLALDLLSGVTGFSLFGAGIAHFAHLGGAAIGAGLTLLWRKHACSARGGY